MSLRKLQSEFAFLTSKLIGHIYEQGYEVTYGDAYRDPRLHGNMGTKLGYGHPRSAHKIRLAIDLNLFKDGEFLEGSDAHRIFGEWWEQQHPLARWGGRFNDGNHYSFFYNGVQ